MAPFDATQEELRRQFMARFNQPPGEELVPEEAPAPVGPPPTTEEAPPIPAPTQPSPSTPPAAEYMPAAGDPIADRQPYTPAAGDPIADRPKPQTQDDLRAEFMAQYEGEFSQARGRPGPNVRSGAAMGIPDDATAALEAAAPASDDDSYLWHTTKGVGARAGDIGSSFLDLAARISDELDKNLSPLVGAALNPAGAAINATTGGSFGDSLREVGSILDGIASESYTPRHNFEEDWNTFRETNNPMPLLGYMAEAAPQTMADVVAAIYAAPVYFGSLVQDFATQRAEYDNRNPDEAEALDYTVAVPTAALSFAIDRALGSGQASRAVNKLIGRVQKESPGLIRRVTGNAAEGFVTEGISGAVEEAATSTGTVKGFSSEATALAGLAEGLAGAPAAGAAGVFREQAGHRTTTEVTSDGMSEAERSALASTPDPTQITPATPQVPPAAPTAPPEAPPAAPAPPPIPAGIGAPAPTEALPTVAPPQTYEGPELPPMPQRQGPIQPLVEPSIPQEALPTSAPTQQPTPQAPVQEAIPTETMGVVPDDESNYDVTPEGEIIAPSPMRGRGMTEEEYQAAYGPEALAEMQAEREAAEAVANRAWASSNILNQIERTGTKNNPTPLRDKAATQLLTGGFVREAIPTTRRTQRDLAVSTSGVRPVGPTREDRTLILDMLQHLADAARVQADVLASNKMFRGSKKASTLYGYMMDAAVTIGRGRELVAEYMSEGTPSLLRGAQAALAPITPTEGKRGRDIGIDTRLLASIGIDRDLLTKAGFGDPNANFDGGTDIEEYRAAIKQVQRAAQGIIQRWEAKSGNVAASAQIRDEGGRGVRPELEGSAAGLAPISRQQEYVDEAAKHPVSQKGVSSEFVVSARDINKDWTGSGNPAAWNYNPNYGKPLPKLTKEEKAEAAEAIAEEEASDLRRRHGMSEATAESVTKFRSIRIKPISENLRLKGKREAAEKVGRELKAQYQTHSVKLAMSRLRKEEAESARRQAEAAERRKGERSRQEEDLRGLRDQIEADAVRFEQEFGVANEKGDEKAAAAAEREADRRKQRLDELIDANEILREDRRNELRDEIDEWRLELKDINSEIKKREEPDFDPEELDEFADSLEELNERKEGLEDAILANREEIARLNDLSAEEAKSKKKIKLPTDEPAPPLSNRQQRNKAADRAIRLFTNAANREGSNQKDDLDTIQALAKITWREAATYRPPMGGYLVVNPVVGMEGLPKDEKGRPPIRHFTKMFGIQPRVKKAEDRQPGEPIMARYPGVVQVLTPAQRKITGGTLPYELTYFTPEQVEATPASWRRGKGLTDLQQKGRIAKIYDEPAIMRANSRFFPQARIDQLVNELDRIKIIDREPGETDSTYRGRLIDIAWRLINTASKEKFTNRSGTRGYEGGNRVVNERLEKGTVTITPPIKDVKGRTAFDIEDDIDDAEVVEEETPATEEIISVEETLDPYGEDVPPIVDMEKLKELLQHIADSAPTKQQREAVESYIKLKKDEVDRLSAQIYTAESLQEDVENEISQLVPNDEGALTYTTPQAYPRNPKGKFIPWRSYIGIETENGRIVVNDNNEYPAGGVEMYQSAVLAEINGALEAARKQRDKLQKELDDAAEQWRQSAGNRQPRSTTPSPPPVASPIQPPTGLGGDPRPTRADVAPEFGSVERVEPTARKPIDLLETTRGGTLPEGDLPAIYPKIVKTAKDGTKTVFAPGTWQYRTSQAILTAWETRLDYLRSYPDSVNGSAILVANGTGSGKTYSIAMAAAEISEKSNLPVLIMTQPNLISNTKQAFQEIGLDPDDSDRYIFAGYTNIGDSRVQKPTWGAVIFDEAHNVKADIEAKEKAGQTAQWANNQLKLKTPFRVFSTATPTDKEGQEMYYAQFMVPTHEKPMTLEESKRWVKRALGVSRNPASYLMRIRDLTDSYVKSGLLVNYSLESITDAGVVHLSGDRVDREALAKGGEFWNEHAKLPGFIEDAMAHLKDPNYKWGVLGVFRLSNTKTVGRTKYKPAIDTAADMLVARGVPRNRILILKGDSQIDLKDVSAGFRDSSLYDVVLMTDSKAGTGASFDDDVGGHPKYMGILGISDVGSQLVQVEGRIDRADTKSTPILRMYNIPESNFDKGIMARLRNKRAIELALVGMPADATEPYFRTAQTAVNLATTPVDQRVNDMLTSGTPTSAIDVLTAIAGNETDPALAEIASGWLNNPFFKGLSVHPMVEGRALGMAQGTTAYVTPGNDSAVTTLHELAHLATHRAIDRPDNRARLRALMGTLSPELEARFPGATRDPHEFVAYAYSDPLFREVLKSTKLPDNRSLWARFVDFVKSVLRVSSTRTKDVFASVMEMGLVEPGTTQDHGQGDPAVMLMTRMYRERPLSDSKLGALQERAVDAKNGAVFRGLLAVRTYDQIVKSFGGLSVDETGVNHLKRVRDLVAARFTRVTQERNKFTKEVLHPLREWSTKKDGGNEKITVKMGPNDDPVTMTRIEYFAQLANISGYAQVHFGKDAEDPANIMLASNRKTEEARKNRSRTDEYWDLHKPQFSKLGAEGMWLYNHLAQHFKEEADLVSTMRAQQWLDTVAKRKDGQSWFNLSPSIVRAEVKRLNQLSPKEIEELDIVKDSLQQLSAFLEPGRVPGAYFPLKRFGDWVVTVTHREAFELDSDRDALMKKYIGATVDHTAKEVVYKSTSRFETESEAREYIKEMQAAGMKTSNVLRAADLETVKREGINSALITQFEKRLDENPDLTAAEKKASMSLFVQSMIDLMPESSYADTYRPRKGRLGASVDIQRSLNNYGSAISHYKAAAIFSTPQRQASLAFGRFIRSLEADRPDAKANLQVQGRRARQLSMIREELAKRDETSITAFTEANWAQTINDMSFAYYLVSAGYNILNMMQPTLVTSPFLAGRFGAAKTSGAMAKAYKAIAPTALGKLAKTGFTVGALKNHFLGKDFDRDNYDILSEIRENLTETGNNKYDLLLKQLADRNMIEATIAMDMAQGSKRGHIDPVTGRAKRQGTLSYLSEWMRMAPHITEVLNRSVTAIASYDLEFARLKKKGLSDAEASVQAVEYAVDAISETQFNYQNWNKPRVIQKNPYVRTALMFKQHPQHVYYYMASRFVNSAGALKKQLTGQKMSPDEVADAKEQAKQLAYFVGMHLAAAGAIGGIPEPLKWMVGLLSWLFPEENEDQPFNYELFVQNKMTDWLGPQLADIGARGLPAAMGLDLSNRVGINQLLLFEAPDTSGVDPFLAGILRIAGGPAASMLIEKPFTAYLSIKEGNYGRAMEAVTPKALRDMARAYRFATEGFTTVDGRMYSSPNNFSPSDFFMTVSGLNPVSTSKVYLSREIEQLERQMMAKRTNIMQGAYAAAMGGTRGDKIKALSRIRAWNKDNPDFTIDKEQLETSMKSRARDQARTRGGILLQSEDAHGQWAAEQNRFRQ